MMDGERSLLVVVWKVVLSVQNRCSCWVWRVVLSVQASFLLGVESCVECTVIVLVGCGKLFWVYSHCSCWVWKAVLSVQLLFFILVKCGKLSVLSVERHCPWMWKVVLVGYREMFLLRVENCPCWLWNSESCSY